MDKGVSQTLIEGTVDAAITKAAKKAPAKKSGVMKDDDSGAELMASKLPTPKLKKLPGKPTSPTRTLKKSQ